MNHTDGGSIPNRPGHGGNYTGRNRHAVNHTDGGSIPNRPGHGGNDIDRDIKKLD